MPVKFDLARKYRIGMRRAGKADPALVAELHAKMRMNAQVPADVMSTRAQVSPAAAFLDAVFCGAKMKGNVSWRTQTHLVGGDVNDEALRDGIFRKPRDPDLKKAARKRVRLESVLVHQQIAEPPGSAVIRQAATYEPHFVAAAHFRIAADNVESGLIQACSAEYGGFRLLFAA